MMINDNDVLKSSITVMWWIGTNHNKWFKEPSSLVQWLARWTQWTENLEFGVSSPSQVMKSWCIRVGERHLWHFDGGLHIWKLVVWVQFIKIDLYSSKELHLWQAFTISLIIILCKWFKGIRSLNSWPSISAAHKALTLARWHITTNSSDITSKHKL